jgi:hypothetical protein
LELKHDDDDDDDDDDDGAAVILWTYLGGKVKLSLRFF